MHITQFLSFLPTSSLDLQKLKSSIEETLYASSLNLGEIVVSWLKCRKISWVKIIVMQIEKALLGPMKYLSLLGQRVYSRGQGWPLSNQRVIVIHTAQALACE